MRGRDPRGPRSGGLSDINVARWVALWAIAMCQLMAFTPSAVRWALLASTLSPWMERAFRIAATVAMMVGALASLYLWHRRRRVESSRGEQAWICSGCLHPLLNSRGPCPECGAAFDRDELALSWSQMERLRGLDLVLRLFVRVIVPMAALISLLIAPAFSTRGGTWSRGFLMFAVMSTGSLAGGLSAIIFWSGPGLRERLRLCWLVLSAAPWDPYKRRTGG